MLFLVTVRDVDKIFMGKESDALWYRIFHIGTGIIRGICVNQIFIALIDGTGCLERFWKRAATYWQQ